MKPEAIRVCLASLLLSLPLAAGEIQEISTGPTASQSHALTSSGNWLAIGSASGVDLHDRRSGAWVQAQHLDAPGDHGTSIAFGTTVSMADDWLAVGAYGANVEGLGGAGVVYLYRREGSLWERKQVLLAPAAHSLEFYGNFVTLADGYLFVRNHPIFGAVRPTLYAYRLDGTRWEFVQELAVQLGGIERRVDFDAPWLVVGEPKDDPHQLGSNGSSGRVRFFELTDEGFEFRQVLHGSTKSEFGASVSVDGGVALIGAPGSQSDAPGHNRAHVFRLDGAGTWVFEATLAPDVVGPDPLSDKFGFAVDLRGDSALVGAPWFDFDGGRGGASCLFERVGGAWTLTEHLRPHDQVPGDELGSGVVLGEQGILVLALRHAHDGVLGAVYAFDL